MREYYMIIDQCIATSTFLKPKYVPRIELANLALNEADCAKSPCLAPKVLSICGPRSRLARPADLS